MKKQFYILFLIALYSDFGCDRSPSTSGVENENHHLGGDVIALVDGAPITRSMLQNQMRMAHQNERDALHALEDQLLLEKAARAQGIEHRGTQVTRKALAQSVLFELERSITADSITEQQLQRSYQERQSEWNGPERRGVSHFLVTPVAGNPASSIAAQNFIRHTIERFQNEGAGAAIWTSLRDEAQRAGLTIVTESIPPFAQNAEIEKSFIDAVFLASSVGVISQPVQTSYGFHAIVIDRIDPEFHRSFEDVKETLHEEALVEARREAFEKLSRELAQRNRVHVYTSTVQRLFMDGRLFENLR